MDFAEGLTSQIFPQTVDVIISGPLPVLETLTAQDVTVTVDVTGQEIGTYQLEPKVDTPSNVFLESILPGTVEVVLSHSWHAYADPVSDTNTTTLTRRRKSKIRNSY